MDTSSAPINFPGNCYITRQDIMSFPFPYKLWLVVHLEYCDFLRWNRDGTVILLDLATLGEYLNTSRSIFRIKNRSVFLRHLEDFKFERLNATPEAEEDVLLQYKNEDFQRHRLDLVAKIRRNIFEDLGKDGKKTNENQENAKQQEDSFKFPPPPALAKESAINARAAERMLGDLCFTYHGGLSNIQRSRLRFQTVLHFQNESRLLMEKLRKSDENAARLRRAKAEQGMGRSSTLGADDEQVIEIPAELFENPHDSVLNLAEDYRPEYAGYYGNCSKETVMNFFGDYLPMYEDGTMEIRKINADNGIATNNSTIPAPIGITSTPTYTINIDPVSMRPSTSTFSPQPQITPELNFSSGLEPIFKSDDEKDVLAPDNYKEIQPADLCNNDIEAVKFMEEFIKFKDPLEIGSTNETLPTNRQDQQQNGEYLEALLQGSSANEACPLNDTENGERFPQMPAACKMELAEDPVENEADFRNFFSQYRASLNLLYDKH